eukprot:Clim_evm25s156 gene=Clim_evmTU25s156
MTRSLAQFLARVGTLKDLKFLKTVSRCCVYIGNESADQDSVVSALAAAYTGFLTSKGDNEVHIPVVQIPMEDIHLRPNIDFLFRKCDMDAENLFFIDDLPAEDLVNAPGLEIVLLDHNALHRKFGNIGDKVTKIIDHHEDAGAHPQAVRIIEKVGSCSSLVMEELNQSWSGDITTEHELCTMAHGTILLDTACMKPEAQRATEKDIAMANILRKGVLEKMSDQDFFDQLQRARADTSTFSVKQLLRMDYKQTSPNGRSRVGISSINETVEEFKKRVGDGKSLERVMAEFQTKHKLDALIVMSSFVDEKKQFHREILFSGENDLTEALIKHLQETGEQKIVVESLNDPEVPKAYKQLNLVVSRKVILPSVEAYIANA